MKKKKCDLVMKGGITSGIVYPGAVLSLSQEYEFVNIGGTSAGAIAATLTAAAEYRRQQGGGTAGFDLIARLPAWLSERVDGRSRLLRLFTPDGETAPLFETALAWLETKGPRRTRWLAVARALLRHFPRYASMAACVGVALMIVAALSADHVAIVAVILSLFAVTVLATIGAAAAEALTFASKTLPRHGFGVCDGRALAEWLATEVESVAGVDRPLTFGDLRGAGLNLEMMTTNLTHGRPYRLPLEGRCFFFTAEDMRGLFPERIVEWMIARAGAPKRERYYALPCEELPVVVATRMSLSFPLLLSAVPLWSHDFGRGDVDRDDRPYERCWFSDGGITSNFPVHFFDAPLPRWPTFAINLAPRAARYHPPGQRVYMARSNRGGIAEWWTPFDDVGGFLRAIAGTMQNWRDNMLLHLPGQRDRIAHVLLSRDEGGLNLSMDEATIADVAARGAEAGRALRERFDWRNHKWVRFLSFMSALEEALEQWEVAFEESGELLEPGQPLPSYRPSAAERAAMCGASLAFLAHLRKNFATRPFRSAKRRPKPAPVLRAMQRT